MNMQPTKNFPTAQETQTFDTVDGYLTAISGSTGYFTAFANLVGGGYMVAVYKILETGGVPGYPSLEEVAVEKFTTIQEAMAWRFPGAPESTVQWVAWSMVGLAPKDPEDPSTW